MAKSHIIYIYIVPRGSPGLQGRPNRAPNWPDKALPNRPINPTDSPKRTAPAHIRTFTGNLLYVSSCNSWYDNSLSPHVALQSNDLLHRFIHRYYPITSINSNQHHLLAHAWHVCSPQEHSIDCHARVPSRGRHRQGRESPLTTHEDVITSRGLPTTLSTNRSVYISCRPPKVLYGWISNWGGIRGVWKQKYFVKIFIFFTLTSKDTFWVDHTVIF